MLFPTIKGSLAPFLQNEGYRYSPTNGYIYFADYKGADRALMTAYQQDWVRAGVACTLVFHQGGTATLEVEDSTQIYTLDIWEIRGDEGNRDIFSHPFITSLLPPPNGDDQVGIIRAGIQNIQSSTPSSLNNAIAAIFSGNTAFNSVSAGNKIILQRFVGLFLRGTTDFRRGVYVLSHKTNVPNIWNPAISYNISDQNVNTIYSPAELLTEVTNSTFWFPVLPTRLQTKLITVSAQLAAEFGGSLSGGNQGIGLPANYQIGWLKGSSTETTTSLNRISIDTSYILEVWSTDLYPYLA